MFNDPIVYQDLPGQRVLDLRSDGVGCIPALRQSNFQMVHVGPSDHIHAGCVEIVLCLRGTLTFASKGIEYPFLPGSVFVSTPEEPHHLHNHPRGLSLYSLLFALPRRNGRVLGFSARESEWLVRSLTHLPKRLFAATPQLKAAFERLFEIYDGERRGSPARRVKMQTAAADLLVSVIEAARRTPRRTPERIASVARRMRENPGADYPVDTLAQSVGLAPVTFSETFKRATGLPPHAYLLSCRIRTAQRLLQDGFHTVAAVARELRFASPQHFATAFKRTVGRTPTEWMAQAAHASAASRPTITWTTRRPSAGRGSSSATR